MGVCMGVWSMVRIPWFTPLPLPPGSRPSRRGSGVPGIHPPSPPGGGGPAPAAPISFEEFQTLMLTHPAMQGHYYRTTTKPAQGPAPGPSPAPARCRGGTGWEEACQPGHRGGTSFHTVGVNVA